MPDKQQVVRIETSRVFDRVRERAKCTVAHKKSLDKLMAQLQSAELSSGAALERLGGGERVMSLRLSQKARVLAVHRVIDGQPTWILLELLLQHEYAKAKFLKPGAVQRFLDRRAAKALPPAVVPAELPSSADAGYCEPMEVSFYDRGVIEPSQEQVDCIATLCAGLSKGRYVGLVAGAPGSGKTAVAHELIERLVGDDEGDEEPIQITYMTESEHLRRERQQEWKQSTLSHDGNVEQVEFQDYESLLKQAGVLADDAKVVGDEQLLAFFERLHSRLRGQYKARAFSSTGGGGGGGAGGGGCKQQPMLPGILDWAFEDFKEKFFELYRQEFMVVAACKDLADYQACGRSHSIYHGEPRLQAAIWDLHADYQKGLRASQQIDLRMTRLEVADEQKVRRVLLVDEALDLSRSQLLVLLQLGIQVVFLGDYNQDLTHASNSIEFLRQLLPGFSPGNNNIIKLTETHRCARNVVSLANFFLGLVQKVTPHGSDVVDAKIKSALSFNGEVQYFAAKQIPAVKAFCESPSTAVICLPSKVEGLKQRLATPLVYTVKQIKGLGYQRIVLWDLIPEELAQRLLALHERGKLKRSELSTEEHVLIPKLHKLFTAISRAKVDVVFMQSKPGRFVPQLLALIRSEVTMQHDAAPVMKVEAPATAESWEKEAARLRREGRVQRAKEIEAQYGLEALQLPQQSSRGDGGGGEKPEPKPKPRQQPKTKPPAVCSVSPPAALAAAAPVAIDSDLQFSFETTKFVKVTKKVQKKTSKRKGRQRTKLVEKDAWVSKKVTVSFDFSSPLNPCEIKQLLACKQGVLLKNITVPHVLALLTHAGLPAQDESLTIKLLQQLNLILASISIDDIDADVIAACQPTSMINRLQQTDAGCRMLFQNCAKVVFFIAQFNQSVAKTVAKYLSRVSSGRAGILKYVLKDDENKGHFCSLLLASREVASAAERLGIGAELAVGSSQREGFRAIHVAAQEGCYELIRGLVKLDADCIHFTAGLNNFTALHLAAANNQADAVRELLVAGANSDARDKDGKTAYHMAAIDGYIEVVRSFIERQIPMQAIGQKGGTVLHYAVCGEHSNVSTLKLLLDAEVVDIDFTCEGRRTALYMALLLGQEDLANELLDHGAKADIVTEDGRTVLHAAVEGRCSVLMIGRLLEIFPGSVDLKSDKGYSPLHQAAHSGHEEAIGLLLQHGADVNADTQGETAVTSLHLAILAHHVGAAKCLLNAPGVDLNRVGGEECNTALILAIGEGLLDLAEDLIEAGADVTLCTNSGLSPKACLLSHMQYMRESRPSIASSSPVVQAQRHRLFAVHDAKMAVAQQVLKMLEVAEAKAQMAAVDDVDANAVGADVVDCHMALSPSGQ